MGSMELLLIALGLAMDAFAVAICKGLSMNKMNRKKAIIIGLWFGIFQGGMPVIGYFLGNTFEDFINSIDHLIAFILLVGIGVNMLKEALAEETSNLNDSINFKVMFILAVATSIDALTIGITFAFFDVNIVAAMWMIGSVTFIISVLGVKLGNKFGDKYQKKAQSAGGIILIGLGIKNLLEHFDLL